MAASALLAALGSTAHAAGPGAGEGARLPGVRVDRDTAKSGTVRAYWTPERRAEAMAHPADAGTAHTSPARQQRTPTDGAHLPDVSMSAGPTPPKDAPRSGDHTARPAADPELSRSLRTPFPHRWPWRQTGLLLFQQANGKPAQCTASVITHENRSTLWTAAHCLYDKKSGGWTKNSIFLPGSRGGDDPYGGWVKDYSVVPQQWIDEPDYRYADMGAMVVKKDAQRGHLQDEVGAYGYEFRSNSPDNDLVFSLGYPGRGYNRPDSDFSGEDQMYCAGDTVDASEWNPLDERLQMDCDMGGGASGGPMVKNLVSAPQIVGTNSHRNVDPSGNYTDNHLFSSEHGAQAAAVYRAVE
ncbi:trypsin-like serine peptidase [Streptomyces sp. NPDC053542]|uniref:trypsin-like serine peptidase n=1 Tax=Streptomyces sp. NPDC053542 TaxID=3365710 RepID=UPI0037D0B1E3